MTQEGPSPETIAKVNELMQQGFELAPEKLVPEATLFQDLGLDSLDAVDMLVHLEDRLGIKVDAERLKNLRTLRDVYQLADELAGACAHTVKSDLSH